MPDSRKHRDPGPQDRVWFGFEAVPGLMSAVSDLVWLFTWGLLRVFSGEAGRGRHRLVERQQVAVLRSSCSDAARSDRRSRQVDVGSLRDQPIRIDGFNLILTLESAFGGGIILGGRDGCYRDLASVHGMYRRVAETRPALELAAR